MMILFGIFIVFPHSNEKNSNIVRTVGQVVKTFAVNLLGQNLLNRFIRAAFCDVYRYKWLWWMDDSDGIANGR